MRSKTPPLTLTPAQQAAIDALCEHQFRFVRRSKHAIQDEVDGRPFNDEEHHLHYACAHCGLATVVEANEGPVPPPVPDDAPCVVLVRGIVSRDEDASDCMSPADSLDSSIEGILTDGNFRYTLGSFRGRGGRKTDLSPDGWSPSIAALAAHEDDAIREGVGEAELLGHAQRHAPEALQRAPRRLQAGGGRQARGRRGRAQGQQRREARLLRLRPLEPATTPPRPRPSSPPHRSRRSRSTKAAR
jgi:hypothetical protein